MRQPPEYRPPCPTCATPVFRLQRSYGVVAAYPCTCWLPPEAARQMAQAWREHE